jgi:diguanylate cyclase (GGDEF)-like protein
MSLVDITAPRPPPLGVCRGRPGTHGPCRPLRSSLDKAPSFFDPCGHLPHGSHPSASGLTQLGWMSRELSAARHAADHDPLTGLPNRGAAEREVRHRLARGEPTYVALLDLDGFKRVNDTYGHACGDQLLRVVAARLTKAVAAGGFAARFGGDEFLMLLPAVGEAMPTASSVLEVLAEPAALHDVTLSPRTSLGITLALPGNDWARLRPRSRRRSR